MVSMVDDAARCASHPWTAAARAGRVPDICAFARADAHLGASGERIVIHQSASHADAARRASDHLPLKTVIDLGQLADRPTG